MQADKNARAPAAGLPRRGGNALSTASLRLARTRRCGERRGKRYRGSQKRSSSEQSAHIVTNSRQSGGRSGPPAPLPYCFSSRRGSTMNFKTDLLPGGNTVRTNPRLCSPVPPRAWPRRPVPAKDFAAGAHHPAGAGARRKDHRERGDRISSRTADPRSTGGNACAPAGFPAFPLSEARR